MPLPKSRQGRWIFFSRASSRHDQGAAASCTLTLSIHQSTVCSPGGLSDGAGGSTMGTGGAIVGMMMGTGGARGWLNSRFRRVGSMVGSTVGTGGSAGSGVGASMVGAVTPATISNARGVLHADAFPALSSARTCHQ